MILDQISIHTFIYKKVAVEIMMKSLENCGVKKFEFYAAAPHFCHYDDFPATPEEIEENTTHIHNIATTHRLKMDCFAPESIDYPLNIASENDGIREKSVHYFLDYLDDLTALGCNSLLLTSGWGYYDKPKLSAWERSCRSLKRIVKRAEELGVTVYLRPISKYSTNLVNNLPSLVRMLYEVNNDHLKACIDCSNLNEASETISDYFEVIPDKIGYFRFYNLTPYGELITGDGSEYIKSCFEELDRWNYTGTAALELNFEHLTNPDYYTDLAVQQLSSLL